MTTKDKDYKADLPPLLLNAVQSGQIAPLEEYLTENSNLPGAQMNLKLLKAFAEEVGTLVVPPAPLVDQLAALLDSWAALTLEAAPVNHPREILPAAAVRAYGQVATVRPDWWDDETGKLYKAATNPRWRVREMVATAWQTILYENWSRAYTTLLEWLRDDNPLVIRAVAAAAAEPPLLKDSNRALDALQIQREAVSWLEKFPVERRREENFKVLRQALAYTLSVPVATVPVEGLALMNELAKSPDADVQWLLNENWKKNRLKKLRDAQNPTE